MNTIVLDAMRRQALSSRRRNLDDILVYMQTLADSEYEGDLQAHVLEIFRTLSEEEQKVVLRRSLVLQWERMLDESKEELSQTSGFYHETPSVRTLQAHREPDFHTQDTPDSALEKEDLKHADKVRSWKDLGMRAFLIGLILAMLSMLFSTVWLDKDASLKNVWGLLDSFIGVAY